jgi:hypothetical protein
MSTFEQILTSPTKLDDIKDIPPFPAGTCLGQIVGPHELVKSGRKETNGAQIMVRLLAVEDDIDREALDAHLTAANRSLHDIQLRYTFWESPYLEQGLRNFFRDALNFPGDWPIPQCFANIPGRNVKVHIRHRPVRSDDGSMRILSEIDSFARAD